MSYIFITAQAMFTLGGCNHLSPSGHNPLLEEEKKLLFCFSLSLPPISNASPAEVGPFITVRCWPTGQRSSQIMFGRSYSTSSAIAQISQVLQRHQ